MAGFAVATRFHRMRREPGGPVGVVVPAGVEIERVDVETDEALHTSTLARHWGFVPRRLTRSLA